MPLQTSGPISLLDIQNEFGGSAPISISEYYAGAGLVPSGTTGINGAIPSSGQISFSQFYGAPSIETQTVTVATGIQGDPGGGFIVFRGYQTGFIGSISDGTFGLLDNAPITEIVWIDVLATLYFTVVGTFPNSGWTKMTIQGVDYFRNTGTHTQSGGATSWVISAFTDPFSGLPDGTQTPVTFTP